MKVCEYDTCSCLQKNYNRLTFSSDKQTSLFGPFVNYNRKNLYNIGQFFSLSNISPKAQVPYSQHSIFFATYELAQ